MIRRAARSLATVLRAAFALLVCGAGAFGAQAPEAVRELPAARPADAVLAGRFVLEGGKPAVGVAVELTGYPLRPKPGVASEAWRSPRVESGDDGRFELAFDAPPSHQFTLNVKVPGYVGATWRWSALRSGERVELGEFVLQRGGTISGRIVDAQGRPVRDGWAIYADRVRTSYGTRGEPARGQGAYDPSEGRFLVEDLPPGPVRVQAYSRMGGWIEGATLDVAADEITEAELVYDGPDNTRRISVQISTQPFYAVGNDVQDVFLSAKDGEPRRGKRDSRSPGWITFDDLDAGPYTVEIRDPRFRPWKRENVEPGTPVEARLVGAGTLVLDVRDGATHAPVHVFGLRTRFEDGLLRGSTIDLYPPGSKPPEDGRIGGFLPIAQTFTVTAEGYAPKEVLVDAFDAPQGESSASANAARANSHGATSDPDSTDTDPSAQAERTPARVVTIELDRGLALEGRLVESDGETPVAFTEVQIVSLQDGGGLAWSPWSDAQTRRTTTDVRGRFRFDALAPGGWRVRAVRSLLETARMNVTLDVAPAQDGANATPSSNGAEPTKSNGASSTTTPAKTGASDDTSASAKSTSHPAAPQASSAPNGVSAPPKPLPSPIPGAPSPAPATALLASADAPAEIVLALPARGALHGRVLVGDELDLAGALVCPTPSSDANELRNRWNALQSMNDLPSGFEVASDGTFTLEHLAAGTWQLELLLPEAREGGGTLQPRGRVPLGLVEIAAGAPTTREFDVRTSGPGALSFTLLVQGQGVEGAELTLTARGAPYPTTVLRTNGDGSAVSIPLLPGDLTVVATLPGRSWTWTAPELARVAPGRVNELVLELRLVEAPLVLVDARTKAPLAERRFTVTQLDATATAPVLRARTSAAGEATIELPTGRYRLQCEVEPPRAGVEPGPRFAPLEFDWTSSGPDPARLELVDAAQPK